MLSVSSSMKKIKVNECELPIDVLKTGAEVDLSGQDLLVEDAIIIAACINVSSSMTSLDLSNNHLARGKRFNPGNAPARYDRDMAGIKAIADALSVSTSLKSLK